MKVISAVSLERNWVLSLVIFNLTGVLSVKVWDRFSVVLLLLVPLSVIWVSVTTWVPDML